MMHRIAAVLAFLAAASSAHAQVPERWRLNWSNDIPRAYSYRTANDEYENYWYMTYTVENPNERPVPLIVDVTLYTNTGKDLQSDVQKVDAARIKDALAAPGKSEQYKYGRFYANVIAPEVESKIIEQHSGIGNRSPGLVLEAIEAFKKGFEQDPPPEIGSRWKKGDRMYLNPSDMRRMRYIQPHQKILGLAIYRNVDPSATAYELHITGLVDVVNVVAVTEDEWQMEYEPQTLKIRYERFGDEYGVEKDMLYRVAHKEYTVQRIGPVATKETLDTLVTELAETLKQERAWKTEEAPAEEIDKRRAQRGIGTLDARIMAMIFTQATGQDFGYDGTKSALENEKAIWRIHEWWVTNRTKLAYNETSTRFEVIDEALPGTVITK